MGSLFSKPKAPSVAPAPVVSAAPPTTSSAPSVGSSSTGSNVTKDPMQDRRRRAGTATSPLLGDSDTNNPSILGG